MIPVSSRSIRAVGYDQRSHILTVEFVSGSVYEYDGVPARVHAELIAAASKGAYFSRHIRDRYGYRKIR